MMEMTIKIEAPEIAAAVVKLAAAIDKTAPNITVPDEGTLNFHVTQTGAVPTVPVVPAPMQTSTPTSAPTAAPAVAPAVPVASAPAYTLDQISRAGAALVDAGKMGPLLALLGKYNVQAVTQLQPNQYGVFATELRALGAQI